jgi:uncharacterized RDD family membrane protein YckC
MQEMNQQGRLEEVSARQQTDFHVAQARGKADLGKRFVAMLIDCVAAMVLGVVPVLGAVLGAAYFLLRDGLEFDFMDGRSLGKKVMKLRPVREDGRPMDIQTSMRRNWMYTFGAVGVIPVVGWILLIPLAAVATAIGVYEVIKVFTDPQGRRLGDAMAKTVVIEVEA